MRLKGISSKGLQRIAQEQAELRWAQSDFFDEDEPEVENDPYQMASATGINVLSHMEFLCGHVINNQWVSALFTHADEDSYSFDIAVDPDYQKMGLGSELADIGVAQFNDLQEGYPDMEFELDAVNPVAVKMMEDRGFHVTDTRGDHTFMTREGQTHSSTSDMYPEGMEIAFYAVTKPPRPYDDTHAYFGGGKTLCGIELTEGWATEGLPSYMVTCPDCKKELSSISQRVGAPRMSPQEKFIQNLNSTTFSKADIERSVNDAMFSSGYKDYTLQKFRNNWFVFSGPAFSEETAQFGNPQDWNSNILRMPPGGRASNEDIISAFEELGQANYEDPVSEDTYEY